MSNEAEIAALEEEKAQYERQGRNDRAAMCAEQIAILRGETPKPPVKVAKKTTARKKPGIERVVDR